MDVSVVFATHNRGDILERVFDCWRIVREHTKYTFEIICSDDASTDNTVEIIKNATDLPITLIAKKQHGGAGLARNAALKVASGKIVIFTGDDIFPNADFINQHYENYLKFGEKTSTLGMIEWHPDIPMNYLMYHITNVGCEQFGFVGLPPYQMIDFRHFYTSNISVPMSQLKALDKLFDTDFDKYGFEDIELGYRLEQNGMKIYYDPDIVAYHHHVYDSVEKFCVRHTTAGEELVIFFRMHPELEDKCIYDIGDLERVFDLYQQKNHRVFLSLKGNMVLFAVNMACLLTRILLKKVSWDKPCFWSKLDSILYAGIFKFCFLMGCMLRIAQDSHIHRSQLAYFVYSHMKKNYSKIYWDTGHGMNEGESRKWVCWDKKEVTLSKELPDNVKAIRISPLKTRCLATINELYFETKNGEIIIPRIQWHNAQETDWTHFDFRNTLDPQIVIQDIPENYQKITVRMSVTNMKKNKSYKIMRRFASIVKQRIRTVKNNRITWEPEYALGQPRRIQICIEGEAEKQFVLVDSYRQALQVLGSAVVVSNSDNQEQGYVTYHYKPEVEPLESTQMLQVAYMLLNSVYDYIVVSKSLVDFPMVGCKSLNDVLIYSELLDMSEKQWFMRANGRFVRLPAYKVETNEVDISGIMNGVMVQQEFLLSNNKDFKPIFRQSRRTFGFVKTKPLIFVAPIFLAVGGVERNTIEVMRALKNEYTFCLLTMERHTYSQGTLHFQLKDICDYIFDLREITEFENFLACLYELKQIFDPDILWLCNNSPWFEANITNIRKIFSDVTMIAQDVYDTQVGWIEYYRNPELKLFNRYIAVTEVIKDVFINKYDIPEKKIDVIYSAIDGSKIRKQLQEKTPKSIKNEKVFGFVGRMTEQKDPLRFLKLVLTVLQKGPEDVHFVMVGAGVLNEEVDKYIAENALQRIVTRISYIENTPAFIGSLDGLILTSRYEGMPIVGIEAMCMSTPIFTTDVGDLRRFITNTQCGWVINEAQSDYDNFLHFYQCLSSYQNAAKEHADEMLAFFEADHVAQRYRETFKKALSS